LKTIAGGYVSGSGYAGDGGLALQAELFDPVSVAVDNLGEIFIADQGNNRIRKVATTGVITTFAGTGVLGSMGDGGPAASAELLGPQAVAVDSTGRVYIGSCYGIGAITPELRVISSKGLITTLAPAFSCVVGLTVDNADNLYVTGGTYGSGTLGISKISPSGTVTSVAGVGGAPGYGGDGGLAIDAQFNNPTAIAFDNQSGNLYVADENNHRVRAISSNGIIRTVAGIGSAGFSGDGGLGTSAELNYPSGVAVDAAGNLYIADSGNRRIRMLTPSGVISTIAGNGAPDLGPLPLPPEFTEGLPPGFSQYPGNGDGGPALLGSMTPLGTMANDSTGHVYFVEPNGSGNSTRMLVPSASTAGCAYSALPAQVTFPTTGSTNSVAVIAAESSCPWLAFSTTDWVSVTSPGTGTGNGTVSYSASPNPLSATRNSIIAVAGQFVSISQTGSPCTFGISVQQISAPAAGISGTVNVTANFPDCSWSASTNAPWLFIIGGSQGQGSGVVNYSVALDSGTARSGTITVAGQTVTFNQAAAPGIASTSVSFVGSAATGTSPFAAGQVISIYGTQLGPAAGSGAQVSASGVVTNFNSGTQVLFDGVAAPILYTGASQVNTAIPCSVAGQASTQMVVQYFGASSSPYTVPLSASAPGIFTADGTGSGEAVVLNQDYSLNGPTNPAARGSAVSFYATGIGPTSPCVDGQTYQSNFPQATLQVVAGVGNLGAQVLYAGQAPYFMTGVNQINIVLPSGSPTGSVPLSLLVNGVFSPPGVTIVVK
jgi:uncharacterized protein (TIGR03437 family)